MCVGLGSRCVHAELVFDIMLDQYGIWLGISALIRGDTWRLSQRLHPYAVPLIREAVKLGCIPTSPETVSLSLLSFRLSSLPLPPSARPTEAFFSHSWEDGTTNVALIGSHRLHAVLSFFSFQLRLLFIFFRCSCRNGLEIPSGQHLSHVKPASWVFWLVKQALP